MAELDEVVEPTMPGQSTGVIIGGTGVNRLIDLDDDPPMHIIPPQPLDTLSERPSSL